MGQKRKTSQGAYFCIDDSKYIVEDLQQLKRFKSIESTCSQLYGCIWTILDSTEALVERTCIETSNNLE